MSSQPENWSKDMLVSELKRRSVPIAPNMPKPYYVKLYREKVMGGAKPNTRQRSEFSSDEETISRRVTEHSRTKHYSKSSDNFSKEVLSYSDTKLLSELKKHGISSGPVTPTTRSLYQKKLAQALFDKAKKQPVSQSSSGVTVASGSDEEFSSEEEIDKGKVVKEIPLPQKQYNLRSSRPSTHKERTLPPKPDKPIKTYRETKKDVVVYSKWCTGWLMVQLLVLLISFLVAVVAFDYVMYDQTRFIDWAISKYYFVLNYAGF